MYNFNIKLLFNLDIKFILMYIFCMCNYLFLLIRIYKRGRESLRRSYRRFFLLFIRLMSIRLFRRN